MKNKINSFENFMKSRLFEAEKLEQAPEEWDQYFSDVKDQKQEAGQESSQGKEIPDWAKKGLSLDALKGKNADQRWEWLTNRVNTVLKDKQTTKVEELKGDNLGGIPGYRLLWKEGKTETGNQQDKSGNIYSVYYTELYKGNPGTWIDKKDEGGKPGAILGKGYWGQNSRIAKTSGGTDGIGASQGVSGGILWIDEPEKVAAKGGTGIGDMSLLDLFAKTEMGQAILTSIMGDSEILKKLKSDGKIDFTDSPPTVEDIDSEFTPEQKKVQEENIKKLKEMGQNVVRPDFKLVTSATDYNYKPSSFSTENYETQGKLYSACSGPICSKEGWFYKNNHFGKEWCGMGNCKEYFGNRVLCDFPTNCGKKSNKLEHNFETLGCGSEKFKCMLKKSCRNLIKQFNDCDKDISCIYSLIIQNSSNEIFQDLVKCMVPSN